MELQPQSASPELCQTLFAETSEGIFISEAQGHFLEVNPQACELLGYSREQLLHLSWRDLLPAEDSWPGLLGLAERNNGQTVRIQSRLCGKNGRSFTGEIRLRSLSDGRRVAFVRNLGEYRPAEETQHPYALLADHSRDIILVVSYSDGRIVEANASATDIYGYSREELLTLSIQDLLAPETHALTAAQMAQGILFETLHRRKDGSIFPVEVNSTGTILNSVSILISIIRDISERKQAEETLQQRETKYHQLFSEMSSGCALHEIICDGDGRPVDYITLEVNHAYERFLNTKNEDVIGKKASEILPQAELNHWLEIFGPVALMGQSTPYEMYSPFNQKYFEGSAYCPEKGKIAVTFTDISERKRTERELHIALEKYRVLFETFPLGISITDEAGNLMEVNRESERLLGLSRPDHTRRTYDGPEWRIVRPDGTPMPSDEYASVRAFQEKRLVENVEMGIVKEGGEITWLNVTAAPIPLEGYGVAVAYGDITEQKRAEDKLLYQANLLQNVSDAIIASDLDFKITSWNQAAETIYGWQAAEVIGQPITDLLQTTYAVETQEEILQQFLTQGIWQGEAIQTRKDGRKITVLASVSFVKDSAGKPIGAVAVNRDITERQQIEAERQAHLRFFASMDQVNRAIQGTNDLEQMMRDVLDVVLSIFDCDRAFLLNPCDPAAPGWRVPMERTRPEYPGALALGHEMPMGPGVAETFRLLLATDGPVQFGPGTPYPLPADVAERFGFKCFMSMALHPKVGNPWEFGLQQCAYARIWTADEERLFQEIGRRLADALTSLLRYRDLLDSERRLTEAQRIAHIGYWERDLEAGRITLSDEACRIFGLAPQTFPLNLEQWHQRWLELIHPEDRERTAQAAAEALQDGPPYNLEYRLIRPNGEVRFIHSEAVVNRDESDRPHSMLGMMQDITERQRAEAALRESEERFRLFMDNSPTLVWVKDTQGRCVYLNQTHEKRLGVRVEAWLGKTNFEMWPPEVAEQIWQNDQKVLAAGHLLEFTEAIPNPDGSLGTWWTFKFPFQDASGQRYVAGIGLDITERKQMEEALYLTRFSVEHADDAIYWLDEEAHIIDVNETACRTLGYSREDMLQRSIFDIDVGMTPELWREDWFLLKQAGIWQGEVTHRTRDGRLIPMEVVANYIEFGDRVLNCSIIRDISERKAAEEARAKLEAQLHQAQKMESIGRLAGGVAHDFNNLLTVILGYSELIQARLPLEDRAREQLEQIRQSAKRAEGLTRQLLAFSRKQMLVPEVFDLNGLVTNLHKMLERLIREDIVLITVLQPDLWSIKADPGQIEQVLMNLVVNARDAMPTGGRLTIETANVSLDDPFILTHPETLSGPGVKLTVADTGCGMDEETQVHIFEPFFTTKEQGKGTGLGLATVYGIVKQSGGEITVDSEPDKGTTFTIYLPVHETDLSGSTAPQPEPVTQPGRETILLVEDEPIVRDFVRVALHDYGYTLLEVNHGYQALALAQQEKSIDLLLTDVVMPDINGRELAERIKALHPQIKVLFMSGYTDDEVLRRGVQMAEMEFMAKPFSPVALAAKVRAILDK